MMKLSIKIFILFFLAVNLSGKTEILGKYDKFILKNNKRNIVYYKINSGNFVRIKMPLYSKLYVRALITNKNAESYYFKIYSDNKEKTYKRKIKKCLNLTGTEGEAVSLRTKILLKKKVIKFTNISDFPLLIRIKGLYENIKFVPYSPAKYGKIIQVKVKNKDYTYYSGKKISFAINGKATLKILSRYNGITDKALYSYAVYDNDKLLEKEDISTGKSNFAKIKNGILSKGSIRYFEIAKGVHKIRIESQSNVIFRFFINEKAVRFR